MAETNKYVQECDSILENLSIALKPQKPPMEKIGKDLQSDFYTFAKQQLDAIPGLPDKMEPYNNRPAVPFAKLPPFIFCAVGSISRCEMAPHSDFDVIILVATNSSSEDVWAVSDWFKRYNEGISLQEGGYYGGFGRMDQLLASNPFNAMNVSYANLAATAPGRNNPDMRIMFHKGEEKDTDVIWDQFLTALKGRERLDSWVKSMVEGGIGDEYLYTFSKYVDTAVWPLPKVNVRMLWRMFSRMTGTLAAVNGHEPIGDKIVFDNLTLSRLRDPSLKFDPRLPDLYLALWEMRYRLHLLFKEEVDVLDLKDPQQAFVKSIWETRFWPTGRLALKREDTRFRKNDFPRMV
jgi:predicted nucleotidyltransferase